MQVIYGAQQLTGKILSRNDLALFDQLPLVPLSPWLGSIVLNLRARIGVTLDGEARHAAGEAAMDGMVLTARLEAASFQTFRPKRVCP